MSLMRYVAAVGVVMVVLASCGVPARSTPTVQTEQTQAPEPTSAGIPTDGTDLTTPPLLVIQASPTVYTIAADGTRVDAGRGIQGDKQHPDWSPDGQRLALESNFNTVWTVAADGSDPVSLFSCEDLCAAVQDEAWSPSGSEVAFMRVIGDGVHTVSAQLVAVDVKTKAVRVLHENTSGTTWNFQPRWAPDGTRLVFVTSVFASNLLSEEQVVRSDINVLQNGRAARVPGTRSCTEPDWSPTQDLIAYRCRDNLYTSRPDGSQRTALTSFNLRRSHDRAIQPTFTSDGRGVVFTYEQGSVRTAAIIDLRTRKITTIPHTEAATHPRLRP